MATRRHLLFFLLLLSPLTGAWAQGPVDTLSARTAVLLPDTVVALPEVIVWAAPPRVQAAAPSRRVTVLDAEAIASTGAQTVAGLLAARTGLFVKRYGAGGPSTVSLRGTGAGQTLVLLDGYRVADPQTGQVDLSLLPTVLLHAVEVVHGTGAARHGSGSLGGVVRLHTLAPTDSLHLRLRGIVGAFGRSSVGGALSGGTGRIAGLAAVEVSRVEGAFPYVNETLVPPRTVRRLGADRTRRTLFGKVHYNGKRRRLGLTAWCNAGERGLPGTANTVFGDGSAASGVRQWNESLRLIAHSTTQHDWGIVRLDGIAQWTTSRYQNPRARSDAGDTTHTQRYTLNTTVHAPIGGHGSVTGGVQAGLDRTALRGGVYRWRLAPFLRAEVAYGHVTLTPALRLDVYRSAGRDIAALSPSLGVTFQPLAWEGLRLKARAGRAFRAPTFGERFAVPGGNPDLRAEAGWSAEAGAAVTIRRPKYRLTAEGTGFTTRLRRQIVWQPSYIAPGVQVWRPKNVAHVTTHGLEAALRGVLQLALEAHLEGGVFFTHTVAQNHANPLARAYGKQLPYVPRQRLKMYLGIAWSAFRFDLSARSVSRRYTTSDETQFLPPYQVVDAQLRYTRRLGAVTATLGLVVKNALNADYGVVRFYPMPPRHARLHLTLDF